MLVVIERRLFRIVSSGCVVIIIIYFLTLFLVWEVIVLHSLNLLVLRISLIKKGERHLSLEIGLEGT